MATISKQRESQSISTSVNALGNSIQCVYQKYIEMYRQKYIRCLNLKIYTSALQKYIIMCPIANTNEDKFSHFKRVLVIQNVLLNLQKSQ